MSNSVRETTPGEAALAELVAAIAGVRVNSIWLDPARRIRSRSHLYAMLDPLRPHQASEAQLRDVVRILRTRCTRLIACLDRIERVADTLVDTRQST